MEMIPLTLVLSIHARYEFCENFFMGYNFFQDINQVEAAFSAWGRQFTSDCNKVKKGTEMKWFDRNVKKLQHLAAITRSRVKC